MDAIWSEFQTFQVLDYEERWLHPHEEIDGADEQQRLRTRQFPACVQVSAWSSIWGGCPISYPAAPSCPEQQKKVVAASC
jgi:hypothetical protein